MSVTRDNISDILAERLSADPSFRHALLSDPRAALGDLTGMSIPASVSITVHEESPSDIHLVIPAAMDITDQDLELVAGGAWLDNLTHEQSPWDDSSL